jgi:hypothetical protein
MTQSSSIFPEYSGLSSSGNPPPAATAVATSPP